MRHFAFFLLCLGLTSGCHGQNQENWRYLDNGTIRLGINLDAGASIGWFSKSGSDTNLVNVHDVGRYLQQSYYGEMDGSKWGNKDWRYNPVQGGSWKNEPAKVLNFEAQPNRLYAKVHPRHWATGQLLTEVLFEQWLSLEGGLARMKFRMTYTGAKSHPAAHQELPALFVPPSLDRLMFADEKGQLRTVQPGFPNEYFKVGEPWAAWVNDKEEGVGIWMPHCKELTCYRVREGNRGDCSYLAPLQTFALTPGLVFDYEVVLTLGSAKEIQTLFNQMPKVSGPPGAE